MRPMRLAFALAAALLLAPAAFAGAGPFDGENYYADKTSFDRIISLANIDEGTNQFCLAIRATFIDTTTNTNRRVVLEASSQGTIASQSANKLVGAFGSVDLTLTIRRGPTTNAVLSPVLFTETISSFCTLEGQLTKGGEMDKVKLWCGLGPDFGAFTIPALTPDPFGPPFPDISRQELLDSIDYAFDKKKAVKLDTSSGEVDIKHVGLEVDVPDEFMTSLTCDFPD